MQVPAGQTALNARLNSAKHTGIGTMADLQRPSVTEYKI